MNIMNIWTAEERIAFQAIQKKDWDKLKELAKNGNVIAITMLKALTPKSFCDNPKKQDVMIKKNDIKGGK